MGSTGWRRMALVGLLLGWMLGCAVPAPANPPLTVTAAKNTVDSWNPNFCKVVEFYGFHKPAESATSQVAYLLITNPSDKTPKPTVFTAHFQLLTLPDGQMRWFLVSLVTPSAGLSRRTGWDNLMLPAKEPPLSTPAAAEKAKN